MINRQKRFFLFVFLAQWGDRHEKSQQGFMTSSSLYSMLYLFKGILNICVMLEYQNMIINQTNWGKQSCRATGLGNLHQLLLLSILCVCIANSCLYGLYIKGRFTSAKTTSVARQQQEVLGSGPLSTECSSQVREKQCDRYWLWNMETDSTADHSVILSVTLIYTTMHVFSFFTNTNNGEWTETH